MEEIKMKKTLVKVLAMTFALCMLLAAIACGKAAPAVTEVGTYQTSRLFFADYGSAKLANGAFNTITLYSDNTFVLCDVGTTSYSGDGETYNPLSLVDSVVHGTYEVVDKDEELKETTIKITSVTRVIGCGKDTDSADIDPKLKAMVTTDCPALGQEVIVSDADHSMTEISVQSFNLNEITDEERQYAVMMWAVPQN